MTTLINDNRECECPVSAIKGDPDFKNTVKKLCMCVLGLQKGTQHFKWDSV